MNPNLAAFGQMAGQGGPPQAPPPQMGPQQGPQFTGPEQGAMQRAGMPAGPPPQVQMALRQIAQQALQRKAQMGAQAMGAGTPQVQQQGPARQVAEQGRGGDSLMVHATPGELMVPPMVQTPKVLAVIKQAFSEAGENPAAAVVGSPQAKVNPQTGVEQHEGGMDSFDFSNAGGDPNVLGGQDPIFNAPQQSAPMGWGDWGANFMPAGFGGSQGAQASDPWANLQAQMAGTGMGSFGMGAQNPGNPIGPGMPRDDVSVSPLGAGQQAAPPQQSQVAPPPVQNPANQPQRPTSMPIDSNAAADAVIKGQYGDLPGDLGLSHDTWKNIKLGGLGAGGLALLAKLLMGGKSGGSNNQFATSRTLTPASQLGTPSQMLSTGGPQRAPSFAGYDPRAAATGPQYNFYPNG